MSQRWDQLEERLDEYDAQIDNVYQLYHIPVLVALMAFMLWVRVRNYQRHIGPEGEPLYRGNDPYYHLRATNYAIENYPFNIPFDPWTGFDVGTRTGQFGTLYDTIVATVAMVVGLGSPQESTVILTTLFVGPILGTLCAIPLYLIGRRLGGRFGGIVGVVVLALTPGQFLSRSVSGFFDHHVAEAFFTVIVLATGVVMVRVAQREKPIYEFIETREFELLKQPAKWGVLFGVSVLLAVLTWPPAVYLFGVFGVFLFFQLSLEFVRGHSPDHITIPWVIGMFVFVVLFAPFIRSFDLTPTDYSILHVLLALGVAAGAVFMAAVSRLWDRIELSRVAYPGVIVGSGLVAVGVVALVLPDVLEFFIGQINRVAGLGSTDTAATVGEAQAVDNPTQFFFRSYGLAFYTALAGLALMLYRVAASERPPAEYLFMSVFLSLMILFTLSQQRFDYYLVLGVGAANAYLVGWIYQFVDLDNVRENITTIKPYQVLIVVAILFVVAGPLVVTGATTSAADRASNPGEMRLWGESLDWMDEETPEVGAYGTGDDDTRLETYGTYEITDDFQYEEGEYGVLAWWDYGHYITQRGERIPVANPFQQRAGLSADFLLAADESNATELLDEQAGEGEGVRYVVVDYKLAYAGTQKYNAPTAFESEYNIGSSDIGVSVFQQGQGVVYGAMTQRGYESMRARLYQFHGSARQAGTVVTQFGEYDQQRGLATRTGEDRRPFRTFNSSEAAAEAAAQDPNAIHGGVLGQPAERVEALEHFRLVHGSERTFRTPVARATGQEPESYIKTFERVDGATIEGTGPANAEVQANVAMEIPTTGQEFVYRQFAQTDANGNFEMTVPYSTTGYDEWGTEAGYTNVSVRANSSYQFIASVNGTWTGQTEVTEGQVLGENETAATVELERALSVGRGGGSGSGGAGGSESGGSSSEDTQGRQTARTP